jgi:hypothetical protein
MIVEGTRSEMRKVFDKYLDDLFGEEIETENDDREEDNYWFGRVRWCKGDIASVLSELGVDASEENINKVYNELKDDNGLQGHMIAAGWEYIRSAICNLFW